MSITYKYDKEKGAIYSISPKVLTNKNIETYFKELISRKNEINGAYEIVDFTGVETFDTQSEEIYDLIELYKHIAKSGIVTKTDCNLGRYVERQTDRKMILWPGYCPTHARITPENVLKRRNEYPEASIIVHPECVPEVTDLADEVLSTGGMIKFVKVAKANEIIVGTESGIIHRFEKENPSKKFIPVSEQAVCPNMKMIRLEDVFYSLKNIRHIINIPSAIRNDASNPIEKMLAGFTLN